jgi:virginiamycin B lyase
MRARVAALPALAAVTVAAAAPSPRVIAVGSHPCGVAAGFGHVWVASDGAGTVSRIDPRTSRVRRVRVGRTACWLATGAGAVWVVRYASGSLVRLDPQTLRTREVGVGPNPEDVAVAAGSVWVTTFDDGMLLRIDPATLRITTRYRLGGNPAGLAALGGEIWVGFGRETTAIARLDPRTGVLRRTPIGRRSPDRLSTDGRSLWVSSVDTLTRVDPKTNRVVKRLRLGGTFGRGTGAGDGKVWVPNKELNTVTRVDPRTNRVVGVLAGGPGSIAAAAAYGSVWVTSYAGTDVRRFALHRRR